MNTPVAVDVGALTCTDLNDIETVTEAVIKTTTTASCQALINELFLLDRVVDEDGVYAQIPDRRIVLPRKKPLPKPQPMTKWESFAKRKNITKKKTSAKALDGNEWKHRYGRKSKANEVPWLVEGKMHDDLDRDPYAEERAAKKDRVTKNKKQQHKNTQRIDQIQSQIEQTKTSRTVHHVKRKSILMNGEDEHVKMKKLMQQVMK